MADDSSRAAPAGARHTGRPQRPLCSKTAAAGRRLLVAVVVALALYAVYCLAQGYEGRHLPAPLLPLSRPPYEPFAQVKPGPESGEPAEYTPAPVWRFERFISADNPYQHYEAAAGILLARGGALQAILAQQSPGSFDQQVSKEELRAALREVAPAIAELSRGAACDGAFWLGPYRRNSFSEVFPELSQLRTLAQVAAAYGRDLAQRGDASAALDVFLDIVEEGNDLLHGPELTYVSVSRAIQAIGLRPMHELLAAGQLSAEDYARAAARLERLAREQPPAESIARRQYIVDRQATEEFFCSAPREVGGWRWALGGLTPWGEDVQKLYALRFVPGRRTIFVIRFDRRWRRTFAALKKPYPQSLYELELLEKEQRRGPLSLFGLAPRFFKALLAHRAVLRGTMLVCALEGYELRAGAYPRSLGELVRAGLISALPEDPFAGRPFVYRRRKSGYLLYSIGPDARDDGGKALRPFWRDKPGDIVFAKGLDIWHAR